MQDLVESTWRWRDAGTPMRRRRRIVRGEIMGFLDFSPVSPRPRKTLKGLALKAEVIAHLAEGHLDRPALHEPADHTQRVLHRLGAQETLRLKLALRIAQQHPADWQRCLAAVEPHRGLRADLQAAACRTRCW